MKNHFLCRKDVQRILMTLFVVFLFAPVSAWAHVESGQAGGFVSGLSHPVSGMDHMLAMIAVGLWGAQLGRPAIWLLPVAFPMMMAFGGMLGLMGIPVPSIVLGALILGEAKMPIIGALIVVAFFAVFHGHAHGTELEAGQNAMLYSMGFVICTGTLHAIGIGMGLVHRWKFGRLALCGAGSFVMAGGMYFLWGALS